MSTLPARTKGKAGGHVVVVGSTAARKSTGGGSISFTFRMEEVMLVPWFSRGQVSLPGARCSIIIEIKVKNIGKLILARAVQKQVPSPSLQAW